VPVRDSTGGGAPAGATPDRPAARQTASIRLLKPAPALARLTAALVARGHSIDRGASTGGASTWVVGPAEDPESAEEIAGRSATGDRILVLGWIGVHPDARAETLHKLWALEESCRATPLPTLALRLGPLVGPASPLWGALAATPPAGRLARKLVHPAVESDVIETLDRALAGAIAWQGWHELGGPDVLDLAELSALARAAGRGRDGEWEPDRDAIMEQRLIEPELWARWAGITLTSVAAESRGWAA